MSFSTLPDSPTAERRDGRRPEEAAGGMCSPQSPQSPQSAASPGGEPQSERQPDVIGFVYGIPEQCTEQELRAHLLGCVKRLGFTVRVNVFGCGQSPSEVARVHFIRLNMEDKAAALQRVGAAAGTAAEMRAAFDELSDAQKIEAVDPLVQSARGRRRMELTTTKEARVHLINVVGAAAADREAATALQQQIDGSILARKSLHCRCRVRQDHDGAADVFLAEHMRSAGVAFIWRHQQELLPESLGDHFTVDEWTRGWADAFRGLVQEKGGLPDVGDSEWLEEIAVSFPSGSCVRDDRVEMPAPEVAHAAPSDLLYVMASEVGRMITGIADALDSDRDGKVSCTELASFASAIGGHARGWQMLGAADAAPDLPYKSGKEKRRACAADIKEGKKKVWNAAAQLLAHQQRCACAVSMRQEQLAALLRSLEGGKLRRRLRWAEIRSMQHRDAAKMRVALDNYHRSCNHKDYASASVLKGEFGKVAWGLTAFEEWLLQDSARGEVDRELVDSAACIVSEAAERRLRRKAQECGVSAEFQQWIVDRMITEQQFAAAYLAATGIDLRKDTELRDSFFDPFGGVIPKETFFSQCRAVPVAALETGLGEGIFESFCIAMRNRARAELNLLLVLLLAVVFTFTALQFKGLGPAYYQGLVADEFLTQEVGSLQTTWYPWEFADVANPDEFWQWTDLVLTLAYGEDGDGSGVKHSVEWSNNVVGGVQLRQWRVPPVSCGGPADLFTHNAGEACAVEPAYASAPNTTARQQVYYDRCFGPWRGTVWNRGEGNDGRAFTDHARFLSPAGKGGGLGPNGRKVVRGYPVNGSDSVEAELPANRSALSSIEERAAAGDVAAQRRLLLFEPWLHRPCNGSSWATAGMPGRIPADAGSFIAWPSYGCDGYTAFLPVSWTRAEAAERLRQLREGGWIDVATRGLMVEFYAHNQHTEMLLRARYLAEVSSSGAWWKSSQVTLFRLWSLSSGRAVAEAVLPCFFSLAITVHFAVATIRKLREVWAERVASKRRRDASAGHNAWWPPRFGAAKALSMAGLLLTGSSAIELIGDALVVLSVAFRIALMAEGKTSSNVLCTAVYPDSLGRVADMSMLADQIEGAGLIVVYGRVLLALRVFPSVDDLIETVVRGGKSIVALVIAFVVIMCGFSTCAWAVYGGVNAEYNGFGRSFTALLFVMLGEFDHYALDAQRPWFSWVFFMLFFGLIICVLFNLIIAVMGSAFGEVAAEQVDVNGFVAKVQHDPAASSWGALGGGTREWGVLSDARSLVHRCRFGSQPSVAPEWGPQLFWGTYLEVMRDLASGSISRVLRGSSRLRQMMEASDVVQHPAVGRFEPGDVVYVRDGEEDTWRKGSVVDGRVADVSVDSAGKQRAVRPVVDVVGWAERNLTWADVVEDSAEFEESCTVRLLCELKLEYPRAAEEEARGAEVVDEARPEDGSDTLAKGTEGTLITPALRLAGAPTWKQELVGSVRFAHGYRITVVRDVQRRWVELTSKPMHGEKVQPAQLQREVPAGGGEDGLELLRVSDFLAGEFGAKQLPRIDFFLTELPAKVLGVSRVGLWVQLLRHHSKRKQLAAAYTKVGWNTDDCLGEVRREVAGLRESVQKVLAEQAPVEARPEVVQVEVAPIQPVDPVRPSAFHGDVCHAAAPTSVPTAPPPVSDELHLQIQKLTDAASATAAWQERMSRDYSDMVAEVCRISDVLRDREARVEVRHRGTDPAESEGYRTPTDMSATGQVVSGGAAVGEIYAKLTSLEAQMNEVLRRLQGPTETRTVVPQRLGPEELHSTPGPTETRTMVPQRPGPAELHTAPTAHAGLPSAVAASAGERPRPAASPASSVSSTLSSSTPPTPTSPPAARQVSQSPPEARAPGGAGHPAAPAHPLAPGSSATLPTTSSFESSVPASEGMASAPRRSRRGRPGAVDPAAGVE